MEQPAQRRRWILPLPTRFGMDPAALAPADSSLENKPGTQAAGVQQASVQLVRRPSQRLAVGTVKGYPSNAAVLETVSRLSEAVRRDGLRFVTQGGRPVFVHLCYDVKNGFNRKGQLAMAVWLAQPGWLQENEVRRPLGPLAGPPTCPPATHLPACVLLTGWPTGLPRWPSCWRTTPTPTRSGGRYGLPCRWPAACPPAPRCAAARAAACLQGHTGHFIGTCGVLHTTPSVPRARRARSDRASCFSPSSAQCVRCDSFASTHLCVARS